MILFISGLVIGFSIGVFIMCLCVISGRCAREKERDER